MADIAKAGNFEAVDERSDHDNFRTGIYEREYDGLLIARCNQNGNYPHHVQAILNGLDGKRVSMDEITRLSDALDAAHKRIAALEAALAPFARLAFRYDGSEDDWFCKPEVQIRHLRAARDLLPSRIDKEDGNG